MVLFVSSLLIWSVSDASGAEKCVFFIRKFVFFIGFWEFVLRDLSSSDCSLWTYPSNRLVTRIKCRWETECSCQFGSEVARISAPVVLWRVQRLTQRRIERWFLAIFEAKRSIEGREAALKIRKGIILLESRRLGVLRVQIRGRFQESSAKKVNIFWKITYNRHPRIPIKNKWLYTAEGFLILGVLGTRLAGQLEPREVIRLGTIYCWRIFNFF